MLQVLCTASDRGQSVAPYGICIPLMHKWHMWCRLQGELDQERHALHDVKLQLASSTGGVSGPRSALLLVKLPAFYNRPGIAAQQATWEDDVKMEELYTESYWHASQAGQKLVTILKAPVVLAMLVW